MRILQVIDSLHIGGAEKLIIDTVPIIANAGYKVDVLLLNGAKTEFYDILQKTNSCSIFKLGSSMYNPLHIFKIVRYLKNYDIIHVHLFPAQYIVVFAKIISFSRVKLVFTEHNTNNKRMTSVFFNQLERFIYKWYISIVCISPQVKAVMMKKFKSVTNKLEVITNGINIELIQKVKPYKKSELGFTQNDILLAMVAGFREQKDQDTVIKAVSKLPNHYKLILIGDGERRDVLKNIVRELNLDERVKFLGLRSDVYSLYKTVDIAVLSSHWEGFGLSAAEAMACGIPTLGSNVEGLSQVIGDSSLLFKKGDVEDLISKIERLTDKNYYNEKVNYSLRRAKAYSIDIMVDKLISLYKKCTYET